MKKTILAILILTINSFSLLAQGQNNLKTKLDEYLKIVRKEAYAPAPDKSLYNEENAEELLQLLNLYYKDSVAKVRLKAYYLTYKSSYKYSNTKLKKIAVYNLVLGLKDKDSGNVGNIANWLTNFNKEDFNESSKDSLRNILHTQKTFLDRIVKLVAFIELEDQVKYLNNNLQNGNYKAQKVIWSAHLALARLDVESEIDFCIDLVRNQPVNDDVIYELVPDLIFTKQKKVYDYIIELLNSNVKNCYSANPENPQKILCGYRVMESLAPAIKNFPLELDSTGDILTDDYEAALKTTREWFNQQSGEYEIIKETY